MKFINRFHIGEADKIVLGILDRDLLNPDTGGIEHLLRERQIGNILIILNILIMEIVWSPGIWRELCIEFFTRKGNVNHPGILPVGITGIDPGHRENKPYPLLIRVGVRRVGDRVRELIEHITCECRKSSPGRAIGGKDDGVSQHRHEVPQYCDRRLGLDDTGGKEHPAGPKVKRDLYAFP